MKWPQKYNSAGVHRAHQATCIETGKRARCLLVLTTAGNSTVATMRPCQIRFDYLNWLVISLFSTGNPGGCLNCVGNKSAYAN